MQSMTSQQPKQDTSQEQRRCYRIKRNFSTKRPSKELVRDLLRAHSGK